MIEIQKNYNGVSIDSNVDLSDERCLKLIQRLNGEEPMGHVVKMKVVELENGSLDVDYYVELPKFERIRRITGYLTGTLDRWNDSKREEERDRVKHEA